jgi:hypothetical protein
MKNLLFTAIFFYSLNSFAQNLVCTSNGYQNITRSGNNNNNNQRVIILKMIDSNVFAESDNLFGGMVETTFKIVSKNNGIISAYELPKYGASESISSISISPLESIATRVTVNPYGASVILYRCNTK